MVDGAAPTVSITSPQVGASLSGSSVTVSADASDDQGLVGVVFKADGHHIGTQDSTSPYSAKWNTQEVADGVHTLTATALDMAGKETISPPVHVVTANGIRLSITLPGDLDGDGQVTLADLRLLIQMLVGLVPVDLARADLDADGRLTLEDLRVLIMILVTP